MKCDKDELSYRRKMMTRTECYNDELS
jgi:hypothetical protein